MYRPVTAIRRRTVVSARIHDVPAAGHDQILHLKAALFTAESTLFAHHRRNAITARGAASAVPKQKKPEVAAVFGDYTTT